MKTKFLNKTVLLILFFITNINQLFADENCPDCPGIAGVPGGYDEEPGAPIDSAVLWLLLLGIAFAYFIHRKTKNSRV